MSSSPEQRTLPLWDGGTGINLFRNPIVISRQFCFFFVLCSTDNIPAVIKQLKHFLTSLVLSFCSIILYSIVPQLSF